MSLSENQHPKTEDLLQVAAPTGNRRSRSASFNHVIIDADKSLSKGATLQHRNAEDGGEVRAALASLDGSPIAGLSSPQVPENAVASGAFHLFAPTSRQAAKPVGQSQSGEMKVFDDFGKRDLYQVRRTGLSGRSHSRVASAPCSFWVGSNALASWESDEPAGTEAQQSRGDADVIVPASLAASMEQADMEDRASSFDDSMDTSREDKENVASPDAMEAPSEVPGFVQNYSGAQAAPALGNRLPLNDLPLYGVPVDHQEHPYSDVESDDEDDLLGPNLADLLDERIRNNADGMYDFEIYCDP